MKNILVAIDFSDKGQAILGHAKEWAAQIEAKIWLLHVAAPDPEYISLRSGDSSTTAAYDGFRLKEANETVQAIVQQLKAEGFAAEGMLVKGKPIQTILSEAERLSANVIAMGARGHGKLHDLVVGSVCQEVVRRSPIPVWVVPVRP